MAQTIDICKEDMLCHDCSTIDLDGAFRFSGIIPNGGAFISSLRPVAPATLGVKDTNEVECCMCRFLDAVRIAPASRVLSHSRRNPHELRAYSCLKARGLPVTREGRLKNPIITLGIQQRLKPYSPENLIMEIAKSHSVSPETPSFFRGCQIDPLQIPYERLQNWLSDCDRYHSGSCKLEAMPQSIRLKVINCYTRELVSLDNGEPYITLSYVWGSTATEDPATPYKEIRASAPQFSGVINDAILVVQRLGHRFLWVDKYCISTDAAEKHIQIASMDAIYAGAYATIVSTASDATCGLPGVSTTPRIPQPTVHSCGKTYISTLPGIEVVLKSSKWSTRGWTYQEALLSRRLLLFTEYQTYFTCGTISQCEAIEFSRDLEPSRNQNGQVALRSSLVNPYKIPKASSDDGFLGHYLRDYTSRDLTYATDALDAFRGVLARLPYYSSWGVPIFDGIEPRDIRLSTSFDRCFAGSLCWRAMMKSHTVLRRNKHFPSWSWVGWHGGVLGAILPWRSPASFPTRSALTYGGLDTPISRVHFTFETKFWLEGSNGDLASVEEACRASGMSKVLPELTPYLHIEGVVIRFKIALDQETVDRAPGTGYLPIIIPNYDTPIPLYCDQHMDLGVRTTEDIGCIEWEGILLLSFSDDDPSHWDFSYVMIVEWNGDTAERKSLVRIDNKHILNVPKSRKRIRLR